MPPDESRTLPSYIWIIILSATLSALAFVYFYLIPNCATLPIRGKVYGECGTVQMGILSVCSVLFLGAAVYSGYRLAAAMSRTNNK